MDALPASIGPYRVLSAIGRGGMGVVYRAQHRDTGTLAAVKTLLLRDRSNLQSLRREIRALAGLSHPGVAHILDDGVESGRPWFAMELHSGPSLRALIDEAVTWEQQLAVLGVLRRLCAPLAFLHGEGLVHRDLKPENIVVGERPVIVDFGLAAQFEGRLSLALLPDGTRGQGTLRYLAPELLSGDPVDARADLYALGCILYELCARQPPFDGSLAAIARGHLDEQPLPLATLAPRLPRELHVLVGRLLAKRPRDRLGHAQDVAAALAACGAAGEIDPVPPRAYVYRPGLAGRGDALESLRAVLRAPRSGVGRLALVAGESGVGKTRLLAEVIREAQERRLTVLMGECQHQASAPLEALRRPLQAIADSCRDRDAEEVDRVFGERGRILALYVPEVLELAGQERHPDPPTLPPRQAEERLLTSLARTFAAFAADRPMLLVLDDLQWADDLTLSFLRHLPVERLSVIASYRSEEMRPEIAALAQSALCVRLERLGDAEVVAMVGDMLAVSPAPPLLGRYLCRQSEGNPFFVAEYLRLAVGEGLLARDAAGSWKFPEQMDAYEALPLPRSLRDLLERRLSGLGEAADAVSAAAAVVDRELDAALIAEMTGLGQPELFRALNELLRRQILDDIGLGRVRFQHAKLREVAYAALGEARAGELHRRAAAAIEASLSREPDPVKREALADEAAAALALHQQRSGQWLPAVHSNRRAARRSMAALARGEALAHLERARDILAKLPETPELLALTIDTLNHAYAARMQLTSAADDANLQMSRAMVPIAERLGDPLWLSTVHANLARSSFTRGDLESCLRHGRLSLAWAEKSGVLSRIAAGSYILAGGCVQAGRMSELLELAPRFREVLELLESSGATQSFGEPYPPFISLANFLAWGYSLVGRRAEAETLLARSLAVAVEGGNRYAQALSHAHWAWGLQHYGDGETCAAHGEEGLRLAREHHFPAPEMMALSAVGAGYAMLGRTREGIRALEQSLAMAQQLGFHSFKSNTYCALAQAYLDAGEIDPALARCAEGLRFSSDTGERKLEGELHRVLGDALAARERFDEAEAELRTSLTLSEEHGTLALLPRARLSLARLPARRG